MNEILDKIPKISRIQYLVASILLWVPFVWVSVDVAGIGPGGGTNLNIANVSAFIILFAILLRVTIGRMKDIGWKGGRLFLSLIVLTGYGHLLLFPYLLFKKPR